MMTVSSILSASFNSPRFQQDRLTILALEEKLTKLRNATIFALNEMLDLKDLNTGMHSTRLAEWAVRIGEILGMPESELLDLETAAILHDIGKSGVPEAVLNKPGKLEPDERKQIEKHPEFGWAILRIIPGFARASLLVLHHHERMDGKGYPSGLLGEEIPLGSKIISIIDSFDAMVSDRCYRKGLDIEESIRRLLSGSGNHFDRDVAKAFIEIAARDIGEVNTAVNLQ
jgi:HD-GYP domain-containing protein (c-di-GMP phosphodiesterase class II)